VLEFDEQAAASATPADNNVKRSTVRSRDMIFASAPS
jgi:hypothetical protein